MSLSLREIEAMVMSSSSCSLCSCSSSSNSNCSSSTTTSSLPIFGGQLMGQTGQPRCKVKSPLSIAGKAIRLLLLPLYNQNHKSVRSLKSNSQIRGAIFWCCLLFGLLILSVLIVCAAARSTSSSSPLPGKGYTVLINTWKRNDLLKKSVVHYASCGGVDSIHVVWSERDPPHDSLRESLKQAIKPKSKTHKEIEIIFDLNTKDSLNNRFKEMKELKTDAVFSIDDDVICPCSNLEFGYTVWQSAPKSMVGFVPRMHWRESELAERYRYGGWWSVWWTGTYSMVLSKAAFFHKSYLELYTHQMLPSIRDYVTKNRNCEDIAMSFLVANVTGSPPIWVQGKIDEIGSTGISSIGGHSEKRSKCVNDFAQLYGMMPLIPTTVKAVDSRTTWFW